MPSGNLAGACARRARIRFIHVSTDFVFDGSSGQPYRPDDATHPLRRLRCEQAGRRDRRSPPTAGLDWTVVRTAWVYASTGRNFVLTMLRLFNERPVVRVVADQSRHADRARCRCSECVWRAATSGKLQGHARISPMRAWPAGTTLPVAIYEEAAHLAWSDKSVDVQPIQTKDYPTPARRPSYSVLDVTATTAALGLTPVHWRTNLRQVLRELRA